MGKYVLVRTKDGYYVTPPGREQSYTARLEEARVFNSRDEAERERCVESERVAALADLIGH